MWKISRQDTSVAIITGIATFLLNPQFGIIIGIACSFINTLSQLATPRWAILGEVNQGGKTYDQELLAIIGDQAQVVSRGESSSSIVDEVSPLIPTVRVYRNLERYEDAKEHQSILIFRFDGNIYFMV
jgi:MFS superfamily sulfate permease-like transporter